MHQTRLALSLLSITFAGCSSGGGSVAQDPSQACFRTESTTLSGGCTLTFDQCNDGHKYTVSCTAADTCTCEVDGAAQGKPFTGTMFCAGALDASKKPLASAQCGWSLK